jgi:hypothetical protein
MQIDAQRQEKTPLYGCINPSSQSNRFHIRFISS